MNRTAATLGLVVYILSASMVVRHLAVAYRTQHSDALVQRPSPPAPDRVEPDSPSGSRGSTTETPAGESPREVTKTAGSEPAKSDPVASTTVSSVTTPTAPEPAKPAGPFRLATLPIARLGELSIADEQRFGELLHHWIVSEHPADADSPLERRIFEAIRPLLDRRKRKEIEIKIVVLDSDDVNAFSHMGGYIYVTRGLSSLAATDEEYRFVVGHELLHIDERHAQSLVAEAMRAGRLEGVGTLQALYHQIAEGFPEAMEFAADDWAVDRMLELDDTKRACLSFLRKFEGLAERSGFRNGRKSPSSVLTSSTQDVENHYRSQPAAWTRLARLSKRLNIGPVVKPSDPPPTAPATRPAPGR